MATSVGDSVDSPASHAELLEQLDQQIAQLRVEVDSLPVVQVSPALQRAHATFSLAHSERRADIAARLRAEGRAVEGAVANGYLDPTITVVEHSQGDTPSHVVIPREEYPELYVERDKLHRFEAVSGIHTNRLRSFKSTHLSSLIDMRAHVASSGH